MTDFSIGLWWWIIGVISGILRGIIDKDFSWKKELKNIFFPIIILILCGFLGLISFSLLIRDIYNEIKKEITNEKI